MNVITNAESKIRKHWLLATASFLFFYPLVVYTVLSLLSNSEAGFIVWVVPVVVGALSMLLIWHCAYRKYGTKLLTFWLIVCPLKMLASLVESFATLDVEIIAIALGEIAIFLWWFFLSLKMKAVNKTIKERLSLKNSEPQQA